MGGGSWLQLGERERMWGAMGTDFPPLEVPTFFLPYIYKPVVARPGSLTQMLSLGHFLCCEHSNFLTLGGNFLVGSVMTVVPSVCYHFRV